MPSIVPDGQEPTVYLVLNDFGRYGRAYSETSEERADLETTIADLMTGQYDRPVRVVAFNTAEGWSADVSEDIAREIMRRLDVAGDDLPGGDRGLRRSARWPGSPAHLAAGVAQIIWETFLAFLLISKHVSDST
jgi:hypothetical protein